MKRSSLRLAAAIAVVLVASCAGIPQDDRYQPHDGGRSNTRAEGASPSDGAAQAHFAGLTE